MEAPQRLAYLFRRYIEKTGTPQEKEELLCLILKAEHDDTLRRLIAETWNEDHPSYPQDKARADTILREILSHGTSEPPPADSITTRPPLPSASFSRGLRAILFNRSAASVLGIVLLSSLTFHLFRRPKAKPIASIPPPTVAANFKAADRCITLPDGSKILLHETAQLEYRQGFTPKIREVTLHGEAYFDIHKDARPFIVHTGAIRTIVLGTAFNINASNEHDIVITVTKGKVKVENAQGEYSILHRDEQLSADSIHLQKTQISIREALAWKKTWLLFNDVTMREAMDTLAQRYHLNVTFANPAAEGCPVTATFNGGESLGEMINVLSKINNMNWSIDRGHVLISGDGCK